MTAQEAILRLAELYVPRTYLDLVREMERRPMSSAEVEAFTGLHRDSAYAVIAALRRARVVCAVGRIERATPGAGGVAKRYGLGSADVVAPRKSGTQANRDYRQRRQLRAMAALATAPRVWGVPMPGLG